MKTLRLLLLAATFSATAFADKPAFDPADTVASILKKQTGQKAELRLKSGEKLGGKIEAVGEKVVHLSALTGQDFFDAVVLIEDISAVLVRTGGK